MFFKLHLRAIPRWGFVSSAVISADKGRKFLNSALSRDMSERGLVGGRSLVQSIGGGWRKTVAGAARSELGPLEKGHGEPEDLLFNSDLLFFCPS